MIRLAEPEIGPPELEAVAAVLRTGLLVQGAQVREFERLVAERVGRRHAVAVSSGTAALHLAMLALGIGPGDEVLVPDFTFPATANAVELAGATPVLVDVDPGSLNTTAEHMRAALSPRTKALLPVHQFGQPADMGPILELGREHGLRVVEDAACALGASYRGRACGALAELGCYSFHPRKVITTGEGGMLVTDDDAVDAHLRLLRAHGMAAREGRVRFELAGFNYRLTDFQAAIGVAQMARLDAILRRRRDLATLYAAELGGVEGLVLPRPLPWAEPAWQSYVVLLPPGVSRDAVQARLREAGIETTLGTHAVSAQPHHQGRARRLPASLRAYETSLSLPLHPRLSDADLRHVATELRAALRSALEEPRADGA